MTRSMRIAVTGASGFLGTHLLRVLAQDLPQASVHPVARDEDLPSCDVIVHLAGSQGIEASFGDPEADLAANAGETHRRLGEVTAAPGHPVFVLASSCAVYGPTDGTGRVAEDATIAPRSPYGASKVAAEESVAAVRANAGIDGRIARIANPYGPGQRRLVVFDLAKRALSSPPPLRVRGTGGEVRDLVHAEDVARGLLAILARGTDGGIYNVGSGEPALLRDVATAIAVEAGLAASEVVFEGIGEPGKVDSFVANIDRLRALGFVPRRALDEGLRETVAWVRGAGA